MARKRKGRDLRVAVVDKPAGITSTSVVNKGEMGTGCKKAGHAGMDNATGVLAVALGETKNCSLHHRRAQAYTFTVRLGQKPTPTMPRAR
jgi:tRNA pseudouridine55 synthase